MGGGNSKAASAAEAAKAAAEAAAKLNTGNRPEELKLTIDEIRLAARQAADMAARQAAQLAARQAAELAAPPPSPPAEPAEPAALGQAPGAGAS